MKRNLFAEVKLKEETDVLAAELEGKTALRNAKICMLEPVDVMAEEIEAVRAAVMTQ
jgi:hypothetical protein